MSDKKPTFFKKAGLPVFHFLLTFYDKWRSIAFIQSLLDLFQTDGDTLKKSKFEFCLSLRNLDIGYETAVKVSLLDYADGGKELVDSSKTKIKKKTINPNWDEEFTFNVKPNKSNVLFEVFSSNKVKDDYFIGQCEIPLVSTLPELRDDSPITLGQKDCVLR